MNDTTAGVVLAVTPIVGIAIGGVVIFFWLLWHHHEVKLRIRTGTYKLVKFDLKTFSLLTGLLLTGIGTMLTVLFAAIDGFSYVLLGGLIPLSVGICLLIFFKVNPDFKAANDK